MTSPETQAAVILREIGATHVLVVCGAMSGYASDDINKLLWIVRIGNSIPGAHVKARCSFSPTLFAPLLLLSLSNLPIHLAVCRHTPSLYLSIYISIYLIYPSNSLSSHASLLNVSPSISSPFFSLVFSFYLPFLFLYFSPSLAPFLAFALLSLLTHPPI